MTWIDTHTHLDLVMQAFPKHPLTTLFNEGHAAEIGHWISVATDLSNGQKLLENFGALKQVSVTAGIHPCSVSPDEGQWPQTLELFSHLARAPEVIALGESGLDSSGASDPKLWRAQHFWFEHHIELALELKKPLIIHCRGAFKEVFALLRARAEAPKMVFHCFTGGQAEAKQALEMGAYLSFSGILTFKNAQAVRDAATYAPEHALLVETDAPYLAPTPHRGKPNQLPWLVLTATELARIRTQSLSRCQRMLWENSQQAFPALARKLRAQQP